MCFLKIRLIFNVFYCFRMFVNKHFTILGRECISQKCYDVIPSVHYFYVKTKMLVDFQIWISLSLKRFYYKLSACVSQSLFTVSMVLRLTYTNFVIVNYGSFVLVTTCLGGWFGINCPSPFFQNVQKSRGWFIAKIAWNTPNQQINENCVLKLVFFKSGQLQNNTPVDTRRKLNAHKTFRIGPGRLLNVLCTSCMFGDR